MGRVVYESALSVRFSRGILCKGTMKYNQLLTNRMDAAVLVYMKEGKTYEEWEELMLNLYDNKKEVAEGKIVYGKANDSTAIILRFDFDPAEMAKRLQDLDVMEKVAEVVEKREMFSISPMHRP